MVDVISGGPTNVAVGTPLSFTHDLTDNGYTAGSDTITSAGLVIVLTDEKGNETYTISFGAAPQVTQFTANISGNTSFPFTVLAPSLGALSASGTLGVTISATSCTENGCAPQAFQFVSSTLTAHVTPPQPQFRQPTNAVPEPGTLALLGLGVAGIAALRRRRLPD